MREKEPAQGLHAHFEPSSGVDHRGNPATPGLVGNHAFPSDNCPYRTTSISGKMRRQVAAAEIAKPSTYRTPNDILSR
jgi:hypothetical protein